MNLSQKQLKLITSLGQKKYRNLHKLFIVEGKKVVEEFLNSDFELYELYCVDPSDYLSLDSVVHIAESDLHKISTFKSPNNVLAIFKIPQNPSLKKSGFILALDAINDPGNLGTIVRLCDWFGVDQLVCSSDTVDCYNSKVVQSSMGSLTRVSIVYTDLENYLKNSKSIKYAALMDGENVYKAKLNTDAVLVLGNEANGIRPGINALMDRLITIPGFGENHQTESLNVSTASAILLSEFRRRI